MSNSNSDTSLRSIEKNFFLKSKFSMFDGKLFFQTLPETAFELRSQAFRKLR